MKVEIRVVADVDWADPQEDLGPVKPGDPLEDRIKDSVEEAIFGALKDREGDGYSHDMEMIISILVDHVKAEIVDYDTLRG